MLLSDKWLAHANGMTNVLAKQHLSNHHDAAPTRPELELELSVH
jgi:hypothetical protein